MRVISKNSDRSPGRILQAIFATALVSIALAAPGASADDSKAGDPKTVVATVGDHKITEQDLDQKVKPQMDELRDALAKRVENLIRDKAFDIRRKTLESMTEDYLISQAAQQQKLSVDAYVKKESAGKSGVTDADAKKFYDQNKTPQWPPYDQAKPQLMTMLNRQALLERLRKNEPVKILLEPKRMAVDSSGHPSIGAKNAPITMIEFEDFQCPYCKASENTVKQVRAKYGDKVRLVHMDFPLSFHSHSMDAAKAARCANDQNKFWQFRDSLFTNQGKLAPSDLKATAKTLGLNTAQFNECFDKGKHVDEIKKDQLVGEQAGVDGTPGFFINGRPLVGAQPLDKFAEIIDDEIASGGVKQASAH
jgi:protein-disulfide isomerase